MTKTSNLSHIFRFLSIIAVGTVGVNFAFASLSYSKKVQMNWLSPNLQLNAAVYFLLDPLNLFFITLTALLILGSFAFDSLSRRPGR